MYTAFISTNIVKVVPTVLRLDSTHDEFNLFVMRRCIAVKPAIGCFFAELYPRTKLFPICMINFPIFNGSRPFLLHGRLPRGPDNSSTVNLT